MDNFLKNIQIRNFKSVQQLTLDCKRVNVFIGKPNVGKSNILEALALLSPHYQTFGDKKFMGDLIRYDEMSNWFYDDNIDNSIFINSDKLSANIRYQAGADKADFIVGSPKLIDSMTKESFKSSAELKAFFDKKTINTFEYVQPLFTSISSNGNFEHLQVNPTLRYNPIKSFRFNEKSAQNSKSPTFLLPPFGSNLFGVVDHNKSLHREITEMFSEYNLDFALYRKEGKFELEKKIDGIVYKYPYTGIADTFKRLIFYLAAIESNTDSVLVMEEPEVHAFPPFTKQLADRITISAENQFFISTHSPYLLNTLIENLSDDELSVFLVYYEDFQTKVHRMTPEDLKEVLDFSIDVFFNLDKFVNDGAPA